MPELPEVTTTVAGLNRVLPGLKITGLWSDYFVKTTNKRRTIIKHKPFYHKFEREILGAKIKEIERRGKYILIHLSNNRTILTHMKMTGHFLYGKYETKISGKKIIGWKAVSPTALSDSFNQFIHLVFSLSNGKELAFSDMRKFGTVTFFETENRHKISELSVLGPEPLTVDFKTFSSQLNKRGSKVIKTVLMDQTVLSGIGNIYSDEILWSAGIHPLRAAASITESERRKMWKAMIEILEHSISLGGDSMSDYRNIFGERGNYQKSHKAYRRTGQSCGKRSCRGKIKRMIIGGRSSHFCDVHQK